MHGARLAEECKVYLHFQCLETGHKRPFYHVVIEGKPFNFTTEEDRVRIQLQPLTNCFKGGGPLWVLDDMWTQIGVLTGNAAWSAVFIWSQGHISVSFFVNDILLDVHLTCWLLCFVIGIT